MKNKNDKTYTDEEIINALLDSYGIISNAAKMLGCSRKTIDRRLSESQAVMDAKRLGRAKFKEEAENTILNAVIDGNVDAAKYVLSRIGKDDGWGDKQELDVNGGFTVILGDEFKNV